jgi:hypothetical protein
VQPNYELAGNDSGHRVVINSVGLPPHAPYVTNQIGHLVLFEGGELVHQIVLKLWRNEQEKDWTLEINGVRHEAITIEWVQELAYRALLDAEDALLDITKKPPQ